jgi:oligopeptide transport system substrate-binding protein
MTFLDLFMTGNGLNRGKWSNREYDSLIVKAKDNPDFHQRLVELILAEKRLMEESPVIPLCYRSQIGLIKPYVKGIVWYSIGPESLKWAYIQEEK